MKQPDRASDLGNSEPASAGRMSLAGFARAFCTARWLFGEEVWPASTGTALAGPAREVAALLGAAFLRGEIGAMVRPIGGGQPERLPAGAWEVDDFAPRFTMGTLNRQAWHDAGARPTHRIFVDETAAEEFISGWLLNRGEEDMRFTPDVDMQHTTGAAVNAPEIEASAQVLVRLPIVLARTGLSRSRLYAKVKAGDFPASKSIGARTVAWREDEVEAWIKSPN